MFSGETEDALLHVTQVIRKAEGNGELIVVNIDVMTYKT